MIKRLIILLLLTVSVFATVTDTTTKYQYFSPNGSNTTFTFTMPCNSSDDIKVEKILTSTGDPTTLVVDTDYTIAATSSDYLNGGVVTISPALAGTYDLTITREIVLTQELSSGAVTHITTEAALDNATRQIQDNRNKINLKTIRIPDSDPANAYAELTDYVSRKGYWLGFDSDTGAPLVGTPAATGITVTSFMAGVNAKSTAELAMAALQGIGVLNVKNATFGATGNGSTNDTSAIQAAIDALAAGQTLFFPKGTYMYSTLAVTTANITIRGEGRGTVLKQITGTTDNGLILTGADGFVIRDMAFNGNALDNRQVRIEGDTDGGLIDNIHISNCTEAGLDIQGSSLNIDVRNSTFTTCEYGAWTAGATTTYINFTNCKFNNNTTDGLLLTFCTGVKITDCDFNSNTEDGFSVASTTVDVQVTNCRAISNGHDGFDTAGVSNGVFTNCIAKSNTYMGFGLSTPTDGIQIIGCVGIDNTLSGIGIGPVSNVIIVGGKYNSNDGLGIDINNSTNVQVIGTECSENDHSGINAKGTSSYIQLIGNRCFNNNQDSLTYSGIYLVDTTDSIVMGNLCYDTQETATQDIGIKEFTGCQRNVITGNSCFGNVTYQINANSSSTIVTNNIGSSSMALTEGYVVSYENDTVFYENEIVQMYGGTYRD